MSQIKEDRRRDHIKDVGDSKTQKEEEGATLLCLPPPFYIPILYYSFQHHGAKVLSQLRKQCKNEVEELLRQSQQEVVHQREW